MDAKTKRAVYRFNGYRLELDASEIFPDDPGAGTPAMVYGPQKTSATYFCALDTGEIEGWEHGGVILEIPGGVHDWLLRMQDTVDAFLNEHTADSIGKGG